MFVIFFPVDNLVVCNDFEKILYLEQQPTQDDRRICVPKIDSTSADICYDEAEALIYRTSLMDDTLITIEETNNQYCAVYYADDSTTPKYCVGFKVYVIFLTQVVHLISKTDGKHTF